MDTEEKARRYDEALEKMRKMLKSWSELSYNGKTFLQDLKHIFPELAESEDEWVPKELIEYLKQKSDYRSCWIAWLKKQKEQKPVEKQDYSGLNDLERAILRGFLSAGVENVPVTIIKETAKECLAQMKPVEWSDDDKAIVGCIACCLDGQFVTEVARKQCLEWFNKHRRDFLNAHHTEWSEEDEEISKRIISDLRWGRRISVSDKDIRQYDEEINWMENKLKSLLLQGSKDSLQPHWKPSEEQMSMLLAVINDPNNAGAESCYMALKSIYNNLKKL